jgi:signal transduction histidine kinase
MEDRNDSKLMIGDEYIENSRRITITDNGPGIGTDIISKCFDPFVTSKSVGSGLGLSIARRLAAQNGAFISLENLPEGGARASLVFASEVSTNSVPQQDG